MQVKSYNPLGTLMYMHVNAITSPRLQQLFGDYSINFWTYPNDNQASDELVTKAVIAAMYHPEYKDWSFQII